MRHIVCADIHGNFTLLKNILEHSNFNKEEDVLVCAGDFCDIGIHTEACLHLLEDNNAVILLGNHELAHVIGQSITPYDYKLDSVPYLLSSWVFNVTSGKWKIAHAFDGILVTHAGVSDLLAEKLKLHGLTVQQIADKINGLFMDSLATTLDKVPRLEFISRQWFGHDDVFSPLWYRPMLYQKFDKVSYPMPVKQIVGHTPNHCYDSLQLKQLTEMGFYFVDPYMGGRMHLPGYCKYAVVENGEVTVVEYDSAKDN